MKTHKGMPGTGSGFWGWRLFFLLASLNFAATVFAILAGDFDKAGLPSRMLPMEIFNNALEAVLWFNVLVLSLAKKPRWAAGLCVFLAGFLWFDVLTTHPLTMPIPPGFLWWGTALVIAMLVAGRKLVMRGIYATDPGRLEGLIQAPLPAAAFRKTLWLFAVMSVMFAITVFSLLHGDYDRSGLPANVLPWHSVANSIEALLWASAAGLIWAGSVRAAGWVGLFAAGMFAWDALTTAFLQNMPIPGQAIWAPFFIFLMLIITSRLRQA